MVINHEFDISHNLGVSSMRFFSHLGDVAVISKHARRLGVEHKGHGKKTLDPFCPQMPSKVLAKCVNIT